MADTFAARRSWALEPRNGLAEAGPEGGVAIEGTEVPGLQDALRVLFHAPRAFPNLRYVGWDLVLTETGPMVIEANHYPSRYYQRNVPLLANERMRRFLAHHGVV